MTRTTTKRLAKCFQPSFKNSKTAQNTTIQRINKSCFQPSQLYRYVMMILVLLIHSSDASIVKPSFGFHGMGLPAAGNTTHSNNNSNNNNVTNATNKTTTGLGNLIHSIKQGPQSKKPTFPQDGLRLIYTLAEFGILYVVLGIWWWWCARVRRRQQQQQQQSPWHATTFAIVFVVGILQLGLAALDLYIWGGRSGSLDVRVWDGPEERDVVVRHSALFLGAIKAGMIRWLVLLQFLTPFYSISSPLGNTANHQRQTPKRSTRIWVTLLAIMYTIVCILWNIVAAMAKDNLHNMKMLMNGQEKLWLKATAILSANAFLLDTLAYAWSCLGLFKQGCFCRFPHRSPEWCNSNASWAIFLLATMYGFILIYTMAEYYWKMGRKMDALFAWDKSNIRTLTEGFYWIAMRCLMGNHSLSPQEPGGGTSCDMNDEESDYSDDIHNTDIASRKAAREVEMAPLVA